VLDGQRVSLPNGLGLLFEPGLTGTMVDVNASRAPADRVRTNAAACVEIGRVISALNLGGLIFIDFLGLETKAERTAVTDALREALTHAVCETDVEPVNHLGVGLVTRARRGFSLVEQQRCLGDIEGRVPVAFARQRQEMIHG
jgi:ribonuclease G